MGMVNEPTEELKHEEIEKLFTETRNNSNEGSFRMSPQALTESTEDLSTNKSLKDQ